MEKLDPRSTALVLIDLQNGVLALPLAPNDASAVLAASRRLATQFRTVGAPVFMVRVGWSPDFGDAPGQHVERPIARPANGFPADWSDFAPGIIEPSDFVILKRQWNAFYGTELDLQLRRRSIKTIVLGGIATNFGVESTARSAWEQGYDVVFATDAMTSLAADLHEFALEKILPRIGIVSASAEIAFADA